MTFIPSFKNIHQLSEKSGLTDTERANMDPKEFFTFWIHCILNERTSLVW